MLYKSLRTSLLVALAGLVMINWTQRSTYAKTIRVVVWDERQPRQKQAYENFLGNAIADHLRQYSDLSIRSVCIDDPGQGLPDSVLDNCDVLIWWGHVRHAEFSIDKAKAIVKRITEGKLSLIALHSAHWSAPFVEAMNEVTRQRTLATYKIDTQNIQFITREKLRTRVEYSSLVTPYVVRRFPEGVEKLQVYLPYCVFPLARNDGSASTVQVLKPKHPILKNIPPTFEVPQTEIYDEPFHVPDPDEVIFEERWKTGEWFRSGCIWKLGKGKVFYFRPGHETYPVFKQPLPLQILTNAVRWLGKK